MYTNKHTQCIQSQFRTFRHLVSTRLLEKRSGREKPSAKMASMKPIQCSNLFTKSPTSPTSRDNRLAAASEKEVRELSTCGEQ